MAEGALVLFGLTLTIGDWLHTFCRASRPLPAVSNREGAHAGLTAYMTISGWSVGSIEMES